jgi:hypothetical protein
LSQQQIENEVLALIAKMDLQRATLPLRVKHWKQDELARLMERREI